MQKAFNKLNRDPKVLDKIREVLDAFPEGITLTDIIKLTDLPKGQVTGIVTAWDFSGYVRSTYKLKEHRNYYRLNMEHPSNQKKAS